MKNDNDKNQIVSDEKIAKLSFYLGIASVITLLFPPISFLFSITAIVTGMVFTYKNGRNKYSTTGIILGSIIILFNAVLLINFFSFRPI